MIVIVVVFLFIYFMDGLLMFLSISIRNVRHFRHNL